MRRIKMTPADLPVKLVRLHNRNPRHGEKLMGGKSIAAAELREIHIKDTGVDGLAESIHAEGLLCPIVVQKSGKGYVVREGNRRRSAYDILRVRYPGQYETIPVMIIHEGTDEADIRVYVKTVHDPNVGTKQWSGFSHWRFALEDKKLCGMTDEEFLEKNPWLTKTEFDQFRTIVEVCVEYHKETGAVNVPWSQVQEIVGKRGKGGQGRTALLKALGDKKKRQLIFSGIKKGHLINPHEARKLVKVLTSGKDVALKIFAKQGIKEAAEYVEFGRKKAQPTINGMKTSTTSIKINDKSLIGRLKNGDDDAEVAFLELMSQTVEVCRAAGREDIIKLAKM